MKKKLLLVVIYLAFISLGLPDSLLGAGWPSMYQTLQTPVYMAGFISMIVAGGTVISSLFSARLIYVFGVSKVTTFSVFTTALALLGFAYSEHFIYLCLLSIPLGLGAGCVDVALNNYVALHYKARHMNWLHCFWGIGAAAGPIIMARYIATGKLWSHGYNTVACIQISIAIILLVSTPLWIRKKETNHTDNTHNSRISFKNLLNIPGLKSALIVFFCYCTLEATFGLWGASYLVLVRDFSAEDAAKLVSVYYGGITIGRFISGFISLKVSNKKLIIMGECLIAIGIVVLLLPFKVTLLPSFFLIGLGCAPIYPSLLHETPKNFTENQSESIMGLQMASAYIGVTLMPFIFGKVASYIGYASLIWFIGSILFIKIYANYNLNKKIVIQKLLKNKPTKHFD